MTTETPSPRRRLAVLPARAWADIAVLTTLAVIGILGFAPSFTDARYLIAGLGGLLVGTLAGIIASLLRTGAITTLGIAVACYFLFGSALAMPTQAIAVVVPSLETLSGLAVGAVFGWADIVTLATPVQAPDYIGVLPYVAAWAVGLVSASIAGRRFATHRRTPLTSLLALLAPVAVYVASVLTGTDEPYFATLRGVAFAIIALVWLAWRVSANASASSVTRRAVLRQKLIGIAVVAAVAVAGGVVVGGAAAPTQADRFVLRENIQPPFDPLQYASPLSGFRAYLKGKAKDEALFSVAGLQSGERIRIATMDAYDGTVWNVTGPDLASDGSGTFQLVSTRLPAVPLLTKDRAITAEVSIEGYREVWIPTVGYPRTLTFSEASEVSSTAIRYNDATGIAVDINRVSKGASYSFTGVTQAQDAPELDAAAVATVNLPQPQNVPDLIGSRASEWAGDAATPYEKLRAIEDYIINHGYLSHGREGEAQSPAGQGADRIQRLLEVDEAMVGDQEQYASAFALMARYLGYPSRVVMGFSPEIADGGGDVTVTGSDVDAWVEVAFDGVGWVEFHPLPTSTEVPTEQAPKPKSKPQPLVRQPPRTDTGQDDLVSAVEIDDSDDRDEFVIPAWVWTIAASVLIPLVLFFIPQFVIAAIKRRRQQRRRRRGPVDHRAAGAWDELVDSYAELGYQAPRDATRVQLALLFEQQFGTELAARDRDREQASQRAESKAQRAQAKASRVPEASAHRPQLSSLLEATVMRAKDASTWRPGVTAAGDPLPIPGLRDVAVATDEAVFSGRDLTDEELDALWASSGEAAVAARGSVSWFRRRLSRFRVHTRFRFVDLAARLNAAAPTQLSRKAVTS